MKITYYFINDFESLNCLLSIKSMLCSVCSMHYCMVINNFLNRRRGFEIGPCSENEINGYSLSDTCLRHEKAHLTVYVAVIDCCLTPDYKLFSLSRPDMLVLFQTNTITGHSCIQKISMTADGKHKNTTV